MKYVTPSDPLISNQKQVNLTGLKYVWSDYRGDGMRVGIFDNAVSVTNPDLAANMRNSDGNGVLHGTAVAGIIGALANNTGTIGIASLADLYTHDIYTGGWSGYDKLSNFKNYDVVNNSWGWEVQFQDTDGSQMLGIIRNNVNDALSLGRDGKGTSIVKSAGNENFLDGRDANVSFFNSHRGVITVGATNADKVLYFSNKGSNVLVSAQGLDVLTTSLTGTTGFSGTSASAPIVTGAITLMLEANPNLGWRDVKTILALSSTHVGSAIGAAPSGSEEFVWTVNGASNLNGGGLHFSNDYGFGNIDIRAAVRLSEVWSSYSTTQNNANEIVKDFHLGTISVGSANFTNNQVAMTDKFKIEHIQIKAMVNASDVNDLIIEVVSPSGTVSRIFDGSDATLSVVNRDLTFSSEAFRGESSVGNWTVRAIDSELGTTRVSSLNATLTITGSANNENTVYHFNDEFGEMLQTDASRGFLFDDVGINWIDAAMTQQGIFMNMFPGTMSYLGSGGAFQTLNAFNHGTGGDGNDVIIGNNLNNILTGGRGKDVFVFDGNSFGHDKILDFQKGGDKIAFTDQGINASNVTIWTFDQGSVVQANGQSLVIVMDAVVDMNDLIFNINLAGVGSSANYDT